MFKNATGVYIIDEDKILLMKRTKKESFGEWYSVGGRMKKEELNDPRRGLLRELKEEAGISEDDLYDITLKYITFRNYGEYIIQNHFYFAALKNKGIQLPICDEGILEWVKIEDLFTKKMPPASYACLKHYFQTGKNNDNIMAVAATNNNGYGEYKFTDLLEFDKYLFD